VTVSRARFYWVASVVLALATLALAAPGFVLAGAPVLVLVLTLLAGCFPGETIIARLRDRRAGHRIRRASARVAVGLRSSCRCSRLLICFSLANRPPPRLLSLNA